MKKELFSSWLRREIEINKLDCATLPKWMKKLDKYQWDGFLGGPREERALIPNYKQIIKKAFPDKKFFDPFDQKQKNAQEKDSWFVKNALAFLYSKTFICMVPEFPMPGVGPEAGMFFLNNSSQLNPLSSLIFIWPNGINPDHGKEICKKMGIVVETIKEAVEKLKDYFDSLKN